MKCPNCGNMIESFKCNECGFDIKKSRLLSAVKFDASEISLMNDYIRGEDDRIAEVERKSTEERERYEQDDKRVLESFYESYEKIIENYDDADEYLVRLRDAYHGKNLQDVYDECLSFYNGAYQRLELEVVGLADNAKEQLQSNKYEAEIDNQIKSFVADRKRLKDLLDKSEKRLDAQRKAKEAADFREKVTEENRKQREQKEAAAFRERVMEEIRKQREQKEAEEREKAARKAEEEGEAEPEEETGRNVEIIADEEGEAEPEEETGRNVEIIAGEEGEAESEEETGRNVEIIADDNRRRKEKRILFLVIMSLCVVACVGVFVWKNLHKTSYGTKGIEITTPESINAFEKLGFYYDKEGSEFDCPWPEELGGRIDHIGMVMESDTGCSLCFSDDFTRLLYFLPESPAGMNMGVLTISNGKEESTVDLGNGYNVPAIALKNAYIIAQMMADNPSNPFLRCFPEEVAKAIEENNSTVILLQGPASETGEFDNTGHVYWGFNIESNDYKFYNAEHNQGRKKVVVGFYTGAEAESGLVGTSAEDVFGKAACDENSALGTLYSELFDKMSDEDNSFNPENMCIELNDETKESLVSILPYLNIQDTNNSAEIISSVERPKNNTDIVQVVKSGKATIYLYLDGSVQLYGEPDESCNYVSQWTEVKEICNIGESVWGLKKDGSILKSSDNEWEFDGWYDIIQITSGAGFGAGLSADGTVHLCGKYEWREIDTSSWTDIKKISAGFDYLVGLKNDGTVLYSGIGITDAFEGALRTWNDMEDICAGVVTAGKDDELIFGLQADGRVVVAGQPTYTKDYMTYDEDWDKDWNNIIQIAAGEQHIVALRGDGTVDYWAVNWEGKDRGQCDGIESWNNVERIFADGYFTIGLTKDGELLYAGSVTPVE